MERRFRLIPIDVALADKLLEALPGSPRLRSLALLTGGHINTNYALSLADGRCLVLRIYAQGAAAFRKEVDLLHALAGSVPLPGVLLAAFEPRLLAHPYAVIEWIDGLALSDVLRAEPAAAVGEAVAAALLRIGRCSIQPTPFRRSSTTSETACSHAEQRRGSAPRPPRGSGRSSKSAGLSSRNCVRPKCWSMATSRATIFSCEKGGEDGGLLLSLIGSGRIMAAICRTSAACFGSRTAAAAASEKDSRPASRGRARPCRGRGTRRRGSGIWRRFVRSSRIRGIAVRSRSDRFASSNAALLISPGNRSVDGPQNRLSDRLFDRS